MKVRVYRNLKHGRKSRPLYSVVDVSTGRVVQYRRRLLLRNARFVVRKAGCYRVQEEKRKNVHAFVVGDLVTRGGAFGIDANGQSLPMKVTYNPYRVCAFTDYLTGKPVREARAVLLNEDGISAAYVA